jgi:hypothetical protein
MDINTQLDKIKDKLKKLQAKEKSLFDIGNEEEAASFAAKIQELLLEYQLSFEDLENTQAQSIEIIEVRINTDLLTVGNEGEWVAKLFNSIANSNSCMVIIQKTYNGNYILLIGHELNVEAVKYIVEELIPKIRNAGRFIFNKIYKPQGGREKRNTFIRGFLQGCIYTIGKRLWDNYTRLEYENIKGYELVLNKQTNVENWVRQKYPHLKISKGRSLKGNAGVSHGVEVGKTIGINKSVAPGGVRLLNK